MQSQVADNFVFMLKERRGCNGVNLTRLAQRIARWIAPVNTVMDSELRRMLEILCLPGF
jgi:hypothetical protein